MYPPACYLLLGLLPEPVELLTAAVPTDAAVGPVAAAIAVGYGTVPAETRLSSVSYLSAGIIGNQPSSPDQCFSIGQTFPLAYCGHNRAEGSVSVAVFSSVFASFYFVLALTLFLLFPISLSLPGFHFLP